jgi:DNA-binding transcriptional ArsR family regulator
MPVTLDLEKTDVSNVTFALEPAANGLESSLLLAKNELEPGLHGWVEKTRSIMSGDELYRHRLVITGFFFALLPEHRNLTFPMYLADLEATPGKVLRDRMLKRYAEICLDKTGSVTSKTLNWDPILKSAESYIEFLLMGFGTEHVEEEIERQAYEYVKKPEEMKALIISHLDWFWKDHLETEWSRVQPLLEKTIRAYQQLDLNGLSSREIIHRVTGQDPVDAHWNQLLEQSKRIAFVPNAHTGQYTHKMLVGECLCIFFGARPPEGSQERIPELDRTDIISRLSTLADDTRMQILQLIAEKGEMRAQDIIEAIGLSQPSTSRYLSQLAAAGYLLERRVNTAKVYTLNHDRIEKTLKAVSTFLLDR